MLSNNVKIMEFQLRFLIEIPLLIKMSSTDFIRSESYRTQIDRQGGAIFERIRNRIVYLGA